jgi:hypothetical protein
MVAGAPTVYPGGYMPSPSVDAWSTLFAAMKQLRASWPSRGWSWDGRLNCVSSSFAVELEARARAAAAMALKEEWTPASIGRALPAVREVADRAGGLRSGQLMLTSGAVAASFGYGLWWPWGDGMTTSLRIGLSGPYASSDAMQQLRDVFGVEV